MKELTLEECRNVRGGEAVSLTLVICVLSISLLTILVWKIYTSGKGQLSLPGGFKLQWGN